MTVVGNVKIMATTKGRPVIPIVVVDGTLVVTKGQHLILLVEMVFQREQEGRSAVCVAVRV